MRQHRRMSHHLALAAWCLLALAGTAARADWLVMRDGSRLEIKGPWTVKGNVVVFTMKNNTLGSLKAAAVDLEASAQATAEAQAAAAAAAPSAAPAAKAAPVMVITDKDVGHLDELGMATPAEARAEAAAGAPNVAVTSWDRGYDDAAGGVTVTGLVRNNSKDVALGVAVTVRLLDGDGTLLGTGAANLGTTTLPAGQSTRFEAVFPAIGSFADARFDVESHPVVRIPPQPEAEGEEAAEESEAPPPQ